VEGQVDQTEDKTQGGGGERLRTTKKSTPSMATIRTL
jgi:hypothetical protein